MSMDQLSHIRTVFSIIIGLSVAHLLKGIARIIEDPQSYKPYTVYLLWVASIPSGSSLKPSCVSSQQRQKIKNIIYYL